MLRQEIINKLERSLSNKYSIVEESDLIKITDSDSKYTMNIILSQFQNPKINFHYSLANEHNIVVTARDYDDYRKAHPLLPISSKFRYIELGTGLGGLIPHLVETCNFPDEKKPIALDPVNLKIINHMLEDVNKINLPHELKKLLTKLQKRCQIYLGPKVKFINKTLHEAFLDGDIFPKIADFIIDLEGYLLYSSSTTAPEILSNPKFQNINPHHLFHMLKKDYNPVEYYTTKLENEKNNQDNLRAYTDYYEQKAILKEEEDVRKHLIEQDWIPPEHRKTILIVEDEAGPRETFGDIIKEHGYDVKLTCSMDNALKNLDNTVCMIITDSLYGDGKKLAAKIRTDPVCKLWQNIPIIHAGHQHPDYQSEHFTINVKKEYILENFKEIKQKYAITH